MKLFKYETVDTSTLSGLKRAEYLYAHGWTIIRTGLFLLYFQKEQS